VVLELLARRVEVLRQQPDYLLLLLVSVGQRRELVGDVEPAEKHQQEQCDDAEPQNLGLVAFEPTIRFLPLLLYTMVSGHY
jgi:hypothetical protein